MPIAIIAGSGGLIGSESVHHFVEAGLPTSSASRTTCGRVLWPAPRPRTRPNGSPSSDDRFARSSSTSATRRASTRFAETRRRSNWSIHTAAQPITRLGRANPQVDFAVNANGTLNLLEATRRHAPDATFIFCSTNKVYGDLPNQSSAQSRPNALELPAGHRYFAASTRRCRSTPRRTRCSACPRRRRPDGAGIRAILRNANGLLPRRLSDRAEPLGHELHGFLSYLMRCTMTGHLHRVRLRRASRFATTSIPPIWSPRSRRSTGPEPAAVYNIGGGRRATARCSRR